MGFLSSVEFALMVTLPSVLLLGLGLFLKRRGLVDAVFCAQASKLVFHFGLPMLLFINLVNSDIEYAQQARLLAAGVVSTLILFLGAELYAWKFVPKRENKGVFVQGVFRSNMGILGLAFVQNAYGASGLAGGAVYMGVVTVLYNVLAVITLSRTSEGSLGEKLMLMAKKVATNPLIVAIVIALALQRVHFEMPKVAMQTLHYLGNMSLPLALICAGATFDVRAMFKASDISLQASIGRLLVAPIVAVGVALAFGLSGIPLGVMFLMTATSAAAASYVMARAMGGNDVAAANILGITTFGAPFSAALGIVILHSLQLM